MVLGVDVSRLVGPRTGVGRGIEYLLRAWAGHELPFERVELYSPTPIADLPADERFQPIVLPSRGPGIWWETVHLGSRGSGLDLLFCPYTLPLRYRGRTVVENHGLLVGPNRAPAWRLRSRARTWHAAASARSADAVIAVSEVARADLVRWCGVSDERISVVPLGMSDVFRPARPEETAEIEAVAADVLGAPQPFLLFVGKLSPRRHVPELVEAFARLAAHRPDLHLLVVGPDSAQVGVGELAERRNCTARVHHVDHLGHEKLALLYRGARALVLPSTQEAWSVPIAEALASGCPVVAVDGPWLDGIREAVLTISAPDVDLLADALGRITSDGALAGDLREEGLRRAALFPTHEERARRLAGLLAATARQGSKTEASPDGVANSSGSTQIP